MATTVRPSLLRASLRVPERTASRRKLGAERLNTRGLALALSLLAHAVLAALAVHQARASVAVRAMPTAQTELETLVEVSTPDAEDVTRAVVPPTPSEPARGPLPVVHRAAVSALVHSVREVPEIDGNDAPSAPVASVANAALTAPHFVLSAPAVSAISAAAANGAPGIGAATLSTGTPAEPINEAAADKPATLLLGVPPRYSAAAEASEVEADVRLEIVVDSTGVVLSARSVRHVGYGLDDAALSAGGDKASKARPG